MDTLDAQLQELLNSYKDHFSLQENGKIKCEVNGHTLPPRYDVVSAFIKGPKFQKLIKRHHAQDALKKYEPFIVQSKNFPLMLYCALTGQLMDKSVEAVKKHMQGKKFKRAKERFTNDEIDLRPEPSLESFGIRLPKEQQQASDDEQQQQQQQQANKRSSKKQQQQPAQANGSAAAAADGAQAPSAEAASDEEPAFWMPDDSGSGSEEEDLDSDDEAAAAAGSSDGAMDEDEPGAAGPSGAADPMDEDIPQAANGAAGAAAVGAGKKQNKAAGRSAGSKQKQKAVANGAANGAAAVAGGKKKKNVSRPSSAKKAKH